MNTANSQKNFFIFGKTSKQTGFNKSPIVVNKVSPNKRSIDEFLEENPFSNTRELKFIKTVVEVPKQAEQKQRPNTSLILKKKVWIEKKDKKKYERPASARTIVVNEKNK
jgi:hypothetical protein